MAVRNIATSDTLETFRTEFNAEAINFGDIATLNASLTATTIVGAVNEIYSTALIGKLEGTDFTGSLLVGHGTTGTLDAAQWNVGVGIEALDAITGAGFIAKKATDDDHEEIIRELDKLQTIKGGESKRYSRAKKQK